MSATAFVPAFRHPPVYSPWFTLAEQAPWELGVYEVEGLGLGLGSGLRFSFWDGFVFNIAVSDPGVAFLNRRHAGFGSHVTRWRGIVPPSRLPRFVSETRSQASHRVPALLGLPSGSRAVHVFEAVDCMPGYDLMCSVPLEGDPLRPLFIYRRRDPS